jgi:DNA polymerase III subunit delta'
VNRYIGHDRNMREFTAALNAGKLHHGWIFSGPRGLGKAAFARTAAAHLVDPERRYASMVEHGTHPDIITIRRLPKEPPKEGEEVDPDAELKRSITVEQIRAVQSTLNTRPGMSDKRAIIIDTADDMERGGANALLKSLEEPPVGTYFLLVSHASDRLLPTIRSRCQMLRFDPLSDTEMEAALRNAESDLDDANLRALIAVGAGAPGQALEFAGLDLGELEAAMASIIDTGDHNNQIRSTLADKLALKAAQPRYEAFLRRSPQLIAEHARRRKADAVLPAIEAWEAANILAARAIGLTLDKQSVVFQMGSLLASLQTHK